MDCITAVVLALVLVSFLGIVLTMRMEIRDEEGCEDARAWMCVSVLLLQTAVVIGFLNLLYAAE